MLRSAILTASLALALGMAAPAQVTITGGNATTSPAPVPSSTPNTASELGIPSVPAVNTPFAHVGPQGPPQAQAEPAQSSAPTQPAEVQVRNPEPVSVQVSPAANTTPAVNLGAASLSTNPFVSGDSGTNGKSLGEIAREYKQQPNLNAKTYTNADIQKMDQQASGGITGATAGDEQYPANNGVITPAPGNGNQPAVAAPPSQNQGTTGNGPFAPRSRGYSPAGIDRTPAPPENPPQANAKPSAQRGMAQNNPSNTGIPQPGHAAVNNTASRDQSATLPKTASRLPLLGILGLFTVSVGLFVRHQRAKGTN